MLRQGVCRGRMEARGGSRGGRGAAHPNEVGGADSTSSSLQRRRDQVAPLPSRHGESNPEPCRPKADRAARPAGEFAPVILAKEPPAQAAKGGKMAKAEGCAAYAQKHRAIMGSIAGDMSSFELSPGPALLAFALSRQAGMPEVGTDTRQEWDPLPITGQVRATGDPIADPYQTYSSASDTMRLEFCPAARAEGSGFERRFTTRELGRLVGRLGGEILRTDPLAACLEQTNLPQGMEGAACEARPRPSCGRAMPASTRKRTARCSENSRLDG